ncbi:MAG TPA: TolC family protein [Candidatus Obscuribacterales bacterium]
MIRSSSLGLSLLVAIVLLSGMDGSVAIAQTPLSEPIFSNPVKIIISKDVLTGDLPVLNRSLKLDEAIQIALKDNPTLLETERTWTISKYLSRSALAKLGPSASANLFYAKTNLNQTLFFMNDSPVASWPMQNTAPRGSLLSVVFAARQPLFTGGRLVGGYRAARAQEKQSLASFNADRVKLAQQVRQAYWESALQEARAKLKSQYVVYRQSTVGNTQAKVESGKLPRADLLREGAELANAQTQLNDAYSDLNKALLNLKALLAINFSSNVDVGEGLELVPQTKDLNYYLGAAAASRPEIARARSAIEEMKARQMVARSKYSPQVDLYGLTSNQTGRTPESPDSVANGKWGGMIGIIGGVTLFDSGSRFNELRAANEAVRRAQAAARETEIAVGKEVAAAWIALDLSEKNAKLAHSRVLSAVEDSRLMHARFEAGKAIALEDFQSSVRAFDAQQQELEAIYKYKLTEADLLAASGSI